MKRQYLFLIALTTLFTNLIFSQELKEPDFIGEAYILKSDNTIEKLDKETIQLKTKAGAAVYLVGMGKIKTKIQVDGCCSSVICDSEKEIKLIVRAVDNETDPLSIIQIFKFDVKNNSRLAELASVGTFSGGSSNNLEYLKFNAEKYGEKSYLLTIKKFDEKSQYGIIVNNPNALDQRSTIVSTFSTN